MGNSFNGGPTPNFGHLVKGALYPNTSQRNLYMYNWPDGISYYPFSDKGGPTGDLVAIFRCKPKRLPKIADLTPPTEVFQAETQDATAN